MSTPPGSIPGGPPLPWPDGSQTDALDAALSNPVLLPVGTLFASPQPNVFFVAAAGNESCWDGPLVAAPLLPAVIEGVIGVSAGSRSGIKAYLNPSAAASEVIYAEYSNYDDIDAIRDEGVTALGGNTNALTMSDGSSLSVSIDGDALIGRYTGDVLWDANTGVQLRSSTAAPTPAGTFHKNGYAQWSGTSFATAVAAGLAADIWSEFGDASTGLFSLPAMQSSDPAAGATGGNEYPAGKDLLTALLKKGQAHANVITLV